MRIAVKLIFSLILTIIIVGCAFSVWQVGHERERLAGELDRRAGLVMESALPQLKPLLKADDSAVWQAKFDEIARHDRLAGVMLYDSQDRLIAASTNMAALLAAPPDALVASVRTVGQTQAEQGRFFVHQQKHFYVYGVPLAAQGPGLAHVLMIVQDASYVQERLWHIWSNTFWRVSLQVLLVALVALGLLYLHIMAPIRKAADWLRRIRRGEPPGMLDTAGQLLLGPLANEITKMAKSLEMARLAAGAEARLRLSHEALWTPERLKQFVRSKLGGQPLFVVSNREPYMHVHKGKNIECIVPAGGLVTALEPILKACGGTWIAQGSGDADRETADAHGHLRVPPDEPHYLLRRVWLDPQMEAGFYAGFANEGLWPLCHIAHNRPIFRPTDWEAYAAVNEQFAQTVLEEVKEDPEPNILVQDYHFALLPRLIKSARPEARIALFWHIPWPNPESFGICPWRKEVLQGMLGADLVGFHTQFHCNNFMETVDRYLESRIDYEHFTVHCGGRTSWVKPFPISIEFSAAPAGSAPPPADAAGLLKKHGLQAELLGVGVDRLDYTKGIVERFQAVEYFLEKNPDYCGRFTFVELGAPSRGMIPKYQAFVADMTHEADRINARFQRRGWQPILLLLRHHSHAEILPYYRAAHVCMVTSLHDGMNLVAKEFAAARADEKGVLILSQFTGAARELREALIVNPYDIAQTAAALKQALSMPAAEQAERMRRMRSVLSERNVYRWAGELVGELAQLPSADGRNASP